MKYLITVFLLLFAVSARAQITLEHSYPVRNNLDDFTLREVDSGHYKYVRYNAKAGDSIWVFNLDHSLDRLIVVPNPVGSSALSVIAKGLFTKDSSYGYLIQGAFGSFRAYRDDGALLFSCDTCTGLYLNPGLGLFGTVTSLPQIMSTENGVKMIINHNASIEVYSLPGKLPTCSTMATSAVNPSTAYTNPSLPTSAYPNPSSSSVRIAYELPSGVSSGDLILTTEDGREVKRYRVTSAFSDLLIEAGDLPSGSYFYHLVTEKGESQAQRISLVK